MIIIFKIFKICGIKCERTHCMHETHLNYQGMFCINKDDMLRLPCKYINDRPDVKHIINIF